MGKGDIPQEVLFKGYKSAKDKSEFTTSVIVMAIVMFAVPFLFSMLFMPYFMSGSFFSMDVAGTAEGAWYRGKIYYPSMQMNRDGEKTVIKSITPGSEEKVEIAGVEPFYSPCLMEFNDRLLLFSNDGVGEYKDGRIDVLFLQNLGRISRPFVYEGKPAVIENLPDGLYLRTLSGNKWDKVGKVHPEKSLKKENDSQGTGNGFSEKPEIQVLNLKGEYFFFYSSDNTLFMHKGIPFVDGKESGGWITVGDDLQDWSAISYEGKPAVIMGTGSSANYRSSFNNNIIGLKYDEGSWKRFFEYKAGIIIGLGAFPTEKSDLYVFYSGFPGTSHLLSVKDGRVENDQQIGKSFFSRFPIKWIIAGNIFVMLFYLVIIFSVSKSMSKHRVTEYRDDNVIIPFAPLWKRAVARLIDSTIMIAPVMLLYYKVFTDFFDNFSPQSMFIMMGNIISCFIWILISGLLFSFMEGKSGKTPGKMLMNIKVVGTDNRLHPVGFGRAIVRNLLMMVDQFFNYMAGIILIAFMDNWQRVGDMAAKTIVVEDDNSSS